MRRSRRCPITENTTPRTATASAPSAMRATVVVDNDTSRAYPAAAGPSRHAPGGSRRRAGTAAGAEPQRAGGRPRRTGCCPRWTGRTGTVRPAPEPGSHARAVRPAPPYQLTPSMTRDGCKEGQRTDDGAIRIVKRRGNRVQRRRRAVWTAYPDETAAENAGGERLGRGDMRPVTERLSGCREVNDGEDVAHEPPADERRRLLIDESCRRCRDSRDPAVTIQNKTWVGGGRDDGHPGP